MKIKKDIFKICSLLIIFSFFFWLPSPAGSAEEDEISQLQQKIQRLENRIKDLEALLEKCNALKPEESSSTGWQDKKNWRRLEAGMDMKKVQSILGKPSKTIEGVRILWYYPSIYCGYVSFDSKGNLIGWNEP